MEARSSRRRRRARAVVDALLAAALVAVMATALVEEAPHEYLGIALLALMAAHVVLNRRYFTHLARGRRTPLRVLQLAAVAGLAACAAGQLASALVLSRHAFAFLPAIPGASWARGAHLLLSHWFFVLAFAHAGLQAKARLPVAAKAALAAVACLGAVSFAQLGMFAYLTGQVAFAAADYGSPLALICARYASVAVLVAAASHCARAALLRFQARPHGGKRARAR